MDTPNPYCIALARAYTFYSLLSLTIRTVTHGCGIIRSLHLKVVRTIIHSKFL